MLDGIIIVNEELERMQKEVVVAHFKEHVHERTVEKYRKPVSIADCLLRDVNI
jgi:hypothetical protein